MASCVSAKRFLLILDLKSASMFPHASCKEHGALSSR